MHTEMEMRRRGPWMRYHGSESQTYERTMHQTLKTRPRLEKKERQVEWKYFEGVRLRVKKLEG